MEIYVRSTETGALLATVNDVPDEESVLKFKGRLRKENPEIPEHYQDVF